MKQTLFFIFEEFKKRIFLRQRESKILLFLLAVFISLFLFYVMSVLISSGKNLHGTSQENVSISFLMDEAIDELELRDRRRPKEPKKEEAPPETPKVELQQTEIEKPQMSSDIARLDLPTDFSLNQGQGVAQGGRSNRELSPIFRMEPIYPRQAALKGIEGFVIVQFDVTKTGETDNISILQASPPQIFNSNAIKAIRKWKFKAQLQDAKPVRIKAQSVRLEFTLEK